MHGNFLTKDSYTHLDLQQFTCDESCVKMDIWSFMQFSDNWDCVENNIEESFVFLKNNDRENRSLSLKTKSSLVLKNNFPFHLSNITIYSLDKEVFFWKDIAPEKRLRLTFLKEGIYKLHFSFPEMGDPKEGYFKIQVLPQTLNSAHK